jgi:hypothetical protein
MRRKISKIIICGTLAIFCALWSNPGNVQTVNTQNAPAVIQIDNLRTQSVTQDILSIQEISPVERIFTEISQGLSNITANLSENMCMTCYAAEAFDSNWEVDGAGTWRYKMNDGSYANNAWTLDNTQQNWYLLDSAGNMRSGIFESYGKYYLLDDVRGTGHFGMLVKNGMSFKGITITASTNADDEGALSQESIEKLKALGYNFGSAASVTGTKHVSGGVVTSEGSSSGSNSSGTTKQKYGGERLAWGTIQDASESMMTDEEGWARAEEGRKWAEGKNWDEELKDVEFY